mmetsp:Transcript_61045/g.167434  ORF Transcript_61045/g.167434 Transcript_61045/m.167434 type:complete len:228 (-) Transcript_61045:112-795(-)
MAGGGGRRRRRRTTGGEVAPHQIDDSAVFKPHVLHRERQRVGELLAAGNEPKAQGGALAQPLELALEAHPGHRRHERHLVLLRVELADLEEPVGLVGTQRRGRGGGRGGGRRRDEGAGGGHRGAGSSLLFQAVDRHAVFYAQLVEAIGRANELPAGMHEGHGAREALPELCDELCNGCVVGYSHRVPLRRARLHLLDFQLDWLGPRGGGGCSGRRGRRDGPRRPRAE